MNPKKELLWGPWVDSNGFSGVIMFRLESRSSHKNSTGVSWFVKL